MSQLRRRSPRERARYDEDWRIYLRKLDVIMLVVMGIALGALTTLLVMRLLTQLHS